MESDSVRAFALFSIPITAPFGSQLSSYTASDMRNFHATLFNSAKLASSGRAFL